jgi:hypothetical protein
MPRMFMLVRTYMRFSERGHDKIVRRNNVVWQNDAVLYPMFQRVLPYDVTMVLGRDDTSRTIYEESDCRCHQKVKSIGDGGMGNQEEDDGSVVLVSQGVLQTSSC